MQLAALLYLALAVQTTVLAGAGPMGARADLPLVCTVIGGLWGGWRCGALTGCMAGWLCGVTADYDLGSFMISRLAVGALCGWVGARFAIENPLTAPLCLVSATLLAHGIYGVMSPGDFAQPWPALAASALFNGLLGTPLFWIALRRVLPRAMPQGALPYV